ncbi:CPBP family intramembrane glutamic endopeptidase [Nonomuraea sp. NPDC049269]|uniref:CPBP family intramembrane glutamic endopeptidase n=1 Tax=Nonomuraea sp. NPDC049269 TaxID=3364349 RepID=UPI003713F44E
MRILGAVLVTIAMLFAATFGVMAIGNVLPGGSQAVAPLITVLVLLLVYAYRRFVSHRPWSGLRISLTWWALPQAVLGMLVGLAALLGANAVSVWVGAATWLPPADFPPLMIPLVVIVIALKASFPEELLFRGHLYDTLSDRLSPRAVLAVTTLSFGSIHILSQSPASGITEKLLYVVMAIALGLLCGAARERTGALWMSVGVHNAVYLSQLFPTRDIDYGVQLTLQAAALALSAVLVLAFPAVRSRVSGAEPPVPDALS